MDNRKRKAKKFDPKDSNVYWLVRLGIALERRDLAQEKQAQDELRRRGFTIRYKPKNLVPS